ncbi:MAG: hypothetical protein KDA37_11585, partial [Planctomycetales bacterium]|nr:hypothetical protein [Planctomycetales bacterium]
MSFTYRGRPRRGGPATRAVRKLTLEQLEQREYLAGDVYLINFQPEAAFAPNRFDTDAGAAFGVRGGGLAYGWNVDQSAGAVERSLEPDQRLDTLVAVQSGGQWELAVPNGEYQVTASVGDPLQATTNYVNVEGQQLHAAVATSAGEFAEASISVTVSDGKLTLDAAGAADLGTRLNYVYVIGLPAGANQPPAAPSIFEPSFDGQVVNPSDVHMEAIGFLDPDGDLHANSDWEIWTTDSAGTPLELVWTTIGIDGVERYHTHLGDGVFVSSHAGRSDLLFSTTYLMRARFRDSAGSVSAWSSRTFSTGAATEAFPLEVEDVASLPAPSWKDGLGHDVLLPPSTAPALLRLESATGELLLSIAAGNGLSNTVTNPPALASHAELRLSVFGGASGLRLGATDLAVFDENGDLHEVYLPALDLTAGESVYLWVGSDGSTYYSDANQTTPDFTNLARGSILGFVALEPGFRVEVAAEGLQLPVNIAFVPNPGPDPNDPQFYVTELYGSVKVVLNNGEVLDYATNLLNYNPTGNFPGSGEQGVAGIVVDPV